jgi:hypothetical protein
MTGLAHTRLVSSFSILDALNQETSSLRDLSVGMQKEIPACRAEIRDRLGVSVVEESLE